MSSLAELKKVQAGVVRGAFREQRLTSEDRIITDAAVRRFQCQRAYLRAHAGLRWMNSRSNILRGQRPTASHFAALQQVDNTLRTVCRQPQPCHCLPILSQVLTVYLGASRYHRHLRRQYTSQPGRLSGQVARRRPFPLSNPASTHAPISVTIDPAFLLRPALLRLSIQSHGITHLLLDTHLILRYASSTQF